MKKIKALGKRIERLKKQKLNLEKMQVRTLVKQLKDLFGKYYSPELILTIAKDSWLSASDQQKELWDQQANSFDSSKLIKLGQRLKDTQCQTKKLNLRRTILLNK